MFRKIITYFLILAVVLPILAGAVPLGGKINRAQAEGATTENSNNANFSSPCDFNPVVAVAKSAANAFYEITRTVWIKNALDEMEQKVVSYFVKNDPSSGQTGGSVWTCALYTITYLLYEVVMRISIWIAGFASDLFNVSIQFSLTGKVFDADKNIMIKDGWTLVRDLLNLVFIFILLFAAISTILQYGNMDIKKILPSLIVAALLVNFSLMIAKMVIDASHIFAWEFYNQIDVTNKERLGNKEIFANMQGSVKMEGNFEKKNLANVFLAGFNPQRLLVESEIVSEENTRSVLPAWKEVYEHATKKNADIIDTLWRMIIIILLESALAIFASFILLAGAIMFVARVAVLWIVMIFSPIAFLGNILPKMEEHSGMWWKYLIGQSFFAPAFLFMFMLATKFINSKLVDNLLKVNENNDSKIVEGLHMGEIVVIFFNFFVVAFIFSLCLVVAKQLGGKTAEFGIGWAHKGKALALGGANKMFRYGGRMAGASARYGGGQMADKMLDEEKGWGKSKFAKTLSWMGADSGLRKLGAMKKADEDKKRKEAEKYASGLSKTGLKSLEKEIAGYKEEFDYPKEGMHAKIFEGYEKIIAKKTEEDKEEKLYYESWAELYNKTKLDPAEKDVSAENTKERIKRGELGNMEEEIEKRRKEFNEKKEQEKEDNNLKIAKKNREIRRLEAELAEQRKKGEDAAAGLTENVIDGLDKEISTLNKLNNEITVIDKVIDRHEKKVESYRTRELSKGKPAEEKKEKETKSK